jgi:hypothetical protein
MGVQKQSIAIVKIKFGLACPEDFRDFRVAYRYGVRLLVHKGGLS